MKKIDWTNHFIEFITVVFGILLAFSLNNFNENRQSKTKAATQLEYIKKEIKSNRTAVAKRLAYHKDLTKQLINQPDSAVMILKLSRPVDFAWQISQNPDFNDHIPYETYFRLQQIYTLQNRLIEHNNSAGDQMNSLNLMSPLYLISIGDKEKAKKLIMDKEWKIYQKQSWIPIFQDIVSYKSELIMLYDKFLEK